MNKEILPELKDSQAITLMCPQCKEEITISNILTTNEYATKNPKAKFSIGFRQIFYDAICGECGVACVPKERQ